MTLLNESPPSASDELIDLGGGDGGEIDPALNVDAVKPDSTHGRAPVDPVMAALAGFLSTAAAGWMLGGIFSGSFARVVGILGACIGAGCCFLATRARKPSVPQFMALPAAIGLGVVLTYQDTTSSTNPLTLVIQAITSGGLTQPPVPFDPGWQIILLVLTCSLAVCASVAAVAFGRTRLPVFLPAPVTVAAVLLQQPGKEVVSVAGGLVLAIGALAVGFGSELARDGTASASFEIRRLCRAGGVLVGIVAAMVALTQLGFLFPPAKDSTVIPPKRPQTPPPITHDRVLFTATMKEPTPLRLGVLDVYDGTAWLTPPYDPKRYVLLTAGTPVPAFRADRGPSVPVTEPSKTTKVVINIRDVGEAREVPGVTGIVSIDGAPEGSQFDPRAGTVRLPGRPKPGMSYTIAAAALPTRADLGSIKAVVPDAVKDFAALPPGATPPPAVQSILDAIPAESGAYERLQYVRTKYLQKLTASGPGNPVDVTPARVQKFLTGTPASPFEIAAGEVLMARWAGVPARLGYGYYDDSQQPKNGVYEIRPRDGAMWLEAYFSGYGWTPILGKPPKAESSIGQAKKKQQEIEPNGQISAQLYVPVHETGVRLLYTIVQFWLARVAPIVVTALSVWLLLPGLLKIARRLRRRRWAERTGSRARVIVAYAELRDRAIDLNIGHPSDTPLEFLDALVPDDDHAQLAWLFSRSVWGDLGRVLCEEDVERAETLSRSLVGRLAAAQPLLTRSVSFSSRVSLRDPWTREIPNFYWRPNITKVPSRILRLARRGLTARSWRRLAPSLGHGSVSMLALMFLLAGCVQHVDLSTPKSAAPLLKVPHQVGAARYELDHTSERAFAQYRDVALVNQLSLYVLRVDDVAVGTLQVAAFKPGLRSHSDKVREGVLTTIGGKPRVERVDGERFYAVTVNNIRILIWFTPDGRQYQLLAATKDVVDPEATLAALIAAQQGRSGTTTTTRGTLPVDVRRGSD